MNRNKSELNLIKYKLWANELTFSTLNVVPEAELHKEYKTKFKSILNTLNHVYVVDDIFRSHLENTQHGYTSRNTKTCPSFEALWEKQQGIDLWYVTFSQALSEREISKTISYNFVEGGQGEMTISEILFHVVNHGTYHRGFVSLMMSQIPLMMPANDLTVYFRDIGKSV